MANLLNGDDRLKVLRAIKSAENKDRKEEGLRRFEVLKDRAARFVIDKLEQEFSAKTVKEMRKILSINLAPRIIDELASVYKHSPIRTFSNVNDQQKEVLDLAYKMAKVDSRMAQANRYYKLYDQITLKVTPWDLIPGPRAILPYLVDSVPNEMNPEKADGYVMSVFNKDEVLNANPGQNLANPGRSPYRSNDFSDGVNQIIGDRDDYKLKAERYECWQADANFFMDGKGNIISEDVVNPIEELPFIDVALEKDFEFWVRNGNGIVEFALDFQTQLSDVANLLRLQGYAQAIFTGTKQPENMMIGPNRVLFMQVDENNPTVVPRFEFASPSGDLKASMDFLLMNFRFFLTSKGINPKDVGSSLEGQTFSSGLERLLSMVERFEASKSDMELFRWVEEKNFKLMVKWINTYQGTEFLHPDLQGVTIPEDAKLDVMFKEPESIQTKADKEASVKSRMDLGLLSKKKALMELEGLSEEAAIQALEEINEETQLVVEQVVSDGVQAPESVN